MKNTPSFFSIEAMEYLVKLRSTRDLLVDTPSVDRLFDDGQLTHNIFGKQKEKCLIQTAKTKP